MARIKTTQEFHFSVEGETEKWYFEWLSRQIKNDPKATKNAKIICKIRSPIKYIRGLVMIFPVEVTHVFDYESHDPIHTSRFKKTLSDMNEAEGLGREVKYASGYSNFAFELWILLHATDSFGGLAHRSQYLKPINRVYGENLENLDQFKHERNLKRVLGKISLQNVKDAIIRAKAIQNRNKENGYKLREYKGFTYYKENPSLAIWESVEKILHTCGIIE